VTEAREKSGQKSLSRKEQVHPPKTPPLQQATADQEAWNAKVEKSGGQAAFNRWLRDLGGGGCRVTAGGATPRPKGLSDVRGGRGGGELLGGNAGG